jgi:hypothetical protein
MPELSGRELVREWRKLMDSLVDAVASATGRSEVPRQIVEPMQRQLELVEELIERERRLQAEVADRLLAPTDVAFDLLEQSGATLRRQAEALQAAGDALRETAALMASQAELFEGTIGRLRAPAEAARSALGGERQEPSRRAKRSRAASRKQKR